MLLMAPGFTPSAAAQGGDAAAAFVRVATSYQLTPNVVYHRADGRDLTLDVYRPRGASGPAPTLMYIHGGGWTNGSKEASALTFLPYLEMGWAVVNVSYRLADAAHAPAAVEDCRCALRWIYRNAEGFNFDVERIVVTGNSAGGHLALTTGVLPASAGLDAQCPGDRRRVWTTGNTSTAELKVAAIVNWYGITDVHDLANRTPGTSGNFTEAWLGSRPDRNDVATRVSPTHYIRGDLPPILTIHGDADSIVPYDHATRLHEALDDAGAPNQLLTIPGGGHGGFTPDQNQMIYNTIRRFLGEHGLTSATSNE
ncbi:MAG: alpha/beta hydrolase [Acidobacteria bacterium]|nr:alpha/beta hydrolase [Acidobacteriota bacterium]MXZ71617.1 alpha/beta hydrolase [Acidobacteriota bacterium]MYD69745.1 alpha/beta hydrolase [Acidobacteriota bacterium]MYJ03620.1 alpha/beta hydrolase [Acidobacteriota bacterium]